MNLKEKLKSEILETNWEPLSAHFARGVLYLLYQDLTIEEVGLAMAEDHVSQIKEWLDHGLLYPPTEEQAKSFNANVDSMFDMLIVEPYVLIQQKTL
jgi:hypothetical protein